MGEEVLHRPLGPGPHQPGQGDVLSYWGFDLSRKYPMPATIPCAIVS